MTLGDAGARNNRTPAWTPSCGPGGLRYVAGRDSMCRMEIGEGQLLDLIDAQRNGRSIATHKLLAVLLDVLPDRESDEPVTPEQVEIIATLSLEERQVLLECLTTLGKMVKSSIRRRVN